jgi:ABC-2 type transport system permease protein
MRLFSLGWHFFKIGAMNELQYRVNFFVQLLQSLLALVTGLVGLALVFSHTTDLAGWTRPELLAVMGVHILMGGLIRATIQPNMERLMGDIQNGTLDFTLTRPADAQVLISIREVRIWQFVDVLMGLIVIGYAAFQMQQAVGILQVAAFITALLVGAVIIYCFWLILTTGAFWVIRMEQVVELFQGVYQAGRYPVGIYPDWLRTGLTFLVPITFAVTVPAEALSARLSTETLLLAFGLMLGLLAFSRWFWQVGVRNYSGASA